jgi:hypothetical protein
MDFRTDWEVLYDSVVVGEPEIFSAALGRFVTGDDHAFEDLWPEIGVLPRELTSFLRSPEATALQRPDLGRYVTFLETTRTAQSWVNDAMRDVGSLRAELRAVEPDMQFGSQAARDIATNMTDALAKLSGHQNTAVGLTGPLDRLRALVTELAPPTTPDGDAATSAADVERWRSRAATQTDTIQQELRLVRRATRFAS